MESKKRRRQTPWRAAKQPRHRDTPDTIENASRIATEEHLFHKPYMRYGPVNPPITDPTQIPRDWDGTDNDLDEKSGCYLQSRALSFSLQIQALFDSAD